MRDADLDASVDRAWTVVKGQNPYGPVSDGAIVLSGFHCDAELTIPERGFDAQLDFGHDGVQTVGLGLYFQALDLMRVAPDDNVDRYLRRGLPDRQADRQRACSGTVRLLWLGKEMSLILTTSRRRRGAYERLGIFTQKGTLKMPKMAQRSMVTLV